jgi:hypothetical protein
MYPSEIFGKRILISPLNWGMGHVSRCIPLIKKLKSQNNQIFIASSEDQRIVFESYFETDIIYILHEGYPFRFKGHGNFILDMLINLKELKKRHKSELIEVRNIIEKHGIDIVVSDHRYGFRSEKCISIFMTHQLQLPLPWYFIGGQYWHKKQVSKFDIQWIVDDEIQRLAGKLSNNLGFPNAFFIGHLSRFNQVFTEIKKEFRGVLIFSGPSEYYQVLINRFKKQLISGDIDLIIGNEQACDMWKSFSYKTKFHLSTDWKSTDKILIRSKKIFGYFGYTSLMDIQYLKCEIDFIACPGQLEQLYLQKKS